MLDMKKYIVNERVEREKIAMDIKYGIIDKVDLELLVSNPDIQEAFIGKSFMDKKSKTQWTKEYLDELSYAVVAEGFNADYLYYLNDVAQYVNSKKRNTNRLISGIILTVAIVTLTLFIIRVL